MTLLPGPLLYKIYNLVVSKHINFAVALFPQRINLSMVIATFSFTMLGFLGAIITVLFSLIKTETFQKYKRQGYLDLLIFIYLFAILNLVLSFVLSILSFSNKCQPLLFNTMLMSAINNIFQLCLITLIILNLVRTAGNEKL